MVTDASAGRPRTAADVVLAAEAALAAARERRADPVWAQEAVAVGVGAVAMAVEPAAGPEAVPVPPPAQPSRPRRLGRVRTCVQLVLTVALLIAVLAGLPALAMLVL